MPAERMWDCVVVARPSGGLTARDAGGRGGALARIHEAAPSREPAIGEGGRLRRWGWGAQGRDASAEGSRPAGRLLGMSRISTDEVARVAGLARIALTPEEIERIAGELDVIATSVAKVSEVATPDVPATSHPIPLTNVWREDVVGATLDREEVLSQAPAQAQGMFLVPQMLEED